MLKELSKKILLPAAVVLASSAFAFAGNCPNLMQEIDAAMETTDISDEDKAKVAELRQQGEEQHEAGQHAESVATLEEAKAILGM